MADQRNHRELIEMAWLFALGALDGDDLRAFERHLPGCAECQSELSKAEATVGQLAFAQAPTDPPVRLRAKVSDRLDRVTRPVRVPVRSRRVWWPRLALSFGVASLVLAFAGWWKAMDLNRQVMGLQSQVQDMQSQLLAQTAQLALFRSPGSETLFLQGQEVASEAKGKIVWDPASGSGIFLAAGLPQISPDKTYQLWVIADGKPVSAGVFGVDPNGAGELQVSRIPLIDSIQAFAVTLEPAGGLPQPSGSMYLVGSFPKS